MVKRKIPLLIGRPELHNMKKVDLRLGSTSNPILVELKLYHDKADWKETKSITNTVESDLKFALGHEDIYVGIVDVIPSTHRVHLDYLLHWEEIKINKKIFDRYYSKINPASSPPRERIQKWVLVNGVQILNSHSQ